MRLPMNPSHTPLTTAGLADAPGQGHGRGQHLGPRLLRAHHFQQRMTLAGLKKCMPSTSPGAS
jgi:hypothetical protein